MARVQLLVALVLAPLASAAHAQAPPGSDKLTPGAVAESLVVLRQLDSVVRATPNDAAAWFRRGMVAWALYERDRSKPSISGLDWTLLGRLADTSLRIAAQIDPGYAQYGMMAGRFLLSSGVSITRVASYGLFDAALEAARGGRDKTVYAAVAVEAGRVYWRRYDAVAQRWMEVTGRPCDSTFVINPSYFVPAGKNDARLGPMKGARIWSAEMLNTAMPLPFDAAGEAAYLKAEELFREAFEAQPSFERAYRQFAMLLVERSRWTELGAAARERLASAPWDAWAWLTLGLANQRRNNSRAAKAAFDSAFALLQPEERQRLDRIERILPLSDSTRMQSASPSTRAALQQWYWLSADPLWSQSNAEPRSEFLARVTHAELRWTVEEMKVRGADTDRGETFIRFGPADLVAAFSGSEVCTVWVYNSGLVFHFKGAPTFATSHYADYGKASAIIERYPVRWDNIGLPVIDPMPTQAARFRAQGDSVDFYFATVPPVDSIRKMSEVKSQVRADYWLLLGGLATVVHDSVVPVPPGVRVFLHRLGKGSYVYRTETSAEGSRLAGRASAVVVAGPDTATGFASTGFGMSDLLIATSTDARRGAARRWNDLAVTPLVGAAKGNSQLALVWENYELGEKNRSAQYTVTVVLERARSATGRIAARITGPVARMVGVDQTNDRVAMHFDRTVPHSATILDNVALSLGQTPSGSYRLTVEVTDQVSGRRTSRTPTLVIQ